MRMYSSLDITVVLLTLKVSVATHVVSTNYDGEGHDKVGNEKNKDKE